MPPPPQTAQFDVYTPVTAVSQLSGLYRARLCLTVSFEGLYYWLLLLWALQSLACHHAEPSLSPLPDMYPHLVICCSFLRAWLVLDYAIFQF